MALAYIRELRKPQSTVGKKMAAEILPQYLANLTQRIRHKESQIFYNICLCTKYIVYRRSEDFITLLYLFVNVVKVFVR